MAKKVGRVRRYRHRDAVRALTDAEYTLQRGADLDASLEPRAEAMVRRRAKAIKEAGLAATRDPETHRGSDEDATDPYDG